MKIQCKLSFSMQMDRHKDVLTDKQTDTDEADSHFLQLFKHA